MGKRSIAIIGAGMGGLASGIYGQLSGFANMPKKPMSFVKGLSGRGLETTLPGLTHFYFAGVWATSAGALFMNALSGRKVIETICREAGASFAPGRL